MTYGVQPCGDCKVIAITVANVLIGLARYDGPEWDADGFAYLYTRAGPPRKSMVSWSTPPSFRATAIEAPLSGRINEITLSTPRFSHAAASATRPTSVA